MNQLDKMIGELYTNLVHRPELAKDVESYITKLGKDSKNYRDQLLDTRHELVQKDYKLQNQANVIELYITKNERFEKENKAMRELLALWI